MDFIRKGSADLYHSATLRLYKEQQSPRSITVGLLLTSDLYLPQAASFPHHKHHVLFYTEATLSNWGLSAQRMEQEKEDDMSRRWVGSTRTGLQQSWSNTVTNQCQSTPCQSVWALECSRGAFHQSFCLVPRCCLYLWVMRSEFD